MSNVFGHLPSDDINKAHKIFDALELTLNKARTKKEADITDLFLIETKQGIEFIEKRSWKGRWEAFKNRVRVLFGGENRFDIEMNLKKAIDITSNATKVDLKFYEKCARDQHRVARSEEATSGEDLRQDIYALGIFLGNLKEHVQKSKALQGKDITHLQEMKLALFGGKRTLISAEQKDPEALKNLLKELGLPLLDEELTHVAHFLNNYANRGELFELLDAKAPAALAHLKLALLKAISFSQEEDVEKFQTIFFKIFPPENPPAEQTQASIKNIALVFGDSFIQASGFEGDINSKPYAELASRCLEDRIPPSPKNSALQTLLKNGIPLLSGSSMPATELRDQVKNEVKTSPSQKCVIFGGWADHAIVYEIEKQPDGKYSFRVYNEGAGIEYHKKFSEGYKRERVDGCIAFKDIPEKLLFKKSFFGCLQTLTSLKSEGVEGATPGQLLVEHILPMLGGTEDSVSPHVQSMLAPQRSGTCTYKCVLACLANNMSQEEYKNFKIEFKLFLLDAYLPALQERAEKTIDTNSEYEMVRKDYAVLKRSIEKFSTSLEKLKLILPDAKIAIAQEKVLVYKNELSRVAGQILAYEKKIHAKHLDDSSACQRVSMSSFKVPVHRGEAHDKKAAPLQAQPLTPHTVAALKLISELPETDTPDFAVQLEHILDTSISGSSSYPALYESKLVLDQLLKKLGPDYLWNTQFADPKAMFRHLESVVKLVSQDIDRTSQARDYARLFSFTRGLEIAYTQMQNIAETPFPPVQFPLLDKEALLKLQKMQCSDPFWIKLIDTITHLPVQTRPFGEISFSGGEPWAFELNGEISSAIMSWYNDPKNSELKEKIQTSIAQDRVRQKAEIPRKIAEQQQIIDKAKERIAELQPKIDAAIRALQEHQQKKPAVYEEVQIKAYNHYSKTYEVRYEVQETTQYKQWNAECSRLNYEQTTLTNEITSERKKIAAADLAKNNIPAQVRKDPNYWPWGFLEPEDKDPDLQRSDQYKASFLFAEQSFFYNKLETKDLLPRQFRACLNVGALVANIFEKTIEMTVCPIIPTLLDGYRETPDRLLFRNNENGGFKKKGVPKDRYAAGIENETLKAVYKEMLCKRKIDGVPETSVPAAIMEFMSTIRLDLNEIAYDDILELFSIAQSPGMQINSTLTYFTENPDKLSDSGWFNLFHALVFDKNLLQKAFDDPAARAALVPRLQTFFNRAIQNAIQIADFTTAANLTWAANNAQRYLQYSLDSHGQTMEGAILTASTINTLFEKGIEVKYSKDRPVLLEAVLACCKERFSENPATDDEKKLYAYGSLAAIFHASHPISAHATCQPRSEDACDAKSALRQALSTKPEEEQNAIADLIKQVGSQVFQNMFNEMQDVAIEHVRSGDHFEVKSKSGKEYGTFYLTAASFSPANQRLLRVYDKELPLEVKEVLSKQNISVADVSRMRCYIENGSIYHIQDPESKLNMRYFQQDGSVYIETRISPTETRWLLHLAKKQKLSNIELEEQYVQRLSSQNILYLCDPKTGTPIFKSVRGYHGNEFQHTETGHFVANPPENSLFSAFEDSNCTIYLADKNGSLSEVMFPRLEYRFRKEGNEWRSLEHAGWKLAAASDLFAPHFGKDTGFLVVTNATGQKKVLLPVWDPIKPTADDKRSLNPSYQYEFKAGIEHVGRVVECDFTQGSLSPRSQEARFHLARIYLETGSIDDAEELLFAHDARSTHKPFSKEERAILAAIALMPVSKDIGSRTIKLRMRALYLLEKNKQQFPDENHKPETGTAAKNLAIEYLERLTHLKPLDPTEELFLMKQLQGTSEKIQLRVRELTTPWEDGMLNEPQVKAIIPNRSTKKEPYYESISVFNYAPKPTVVTRVRYYRSRQANTFPFDQTKATEATMKPYVALMRKEAEEASSWKKETKSGFIQTLYLMTKSNDMYVQDVAKSLLEIVEGKLEIPFERKAIAAKRFRIETASANEEKAAALLSDYKLEQQSLPTLQLINAAEDEAQFLNDFVCSTCLEKTDSSAAKTDEEEAPLFDSLNAPEIKTPTVQAKFSEAAADIAIAKTKVKEETYSLAPGADFGTVRKGCVDRLEVATKELASIEQTILQTVATALTNDPVSLLQFTSKKRTLPTIEELAILCAKKDFLEFSKKLYPELTVDGLKELQYAVKQYLVQKQFTQHLSRTIQQIDALLISEKEGVDSDTLNTLINNLGRSFEAKRSYELDDPLASAFLYIETILNIKMRPDQIANIKRFVDGVDQGKDIVLQMIMGAGKTSVLQPILAFLFADPDTLSVVDVPEALFEPVKEGLKQALGNAFRQYVYTMPYERELAKDANFLEAFINTLHETKERGAVFLRTPRVKHSIITSLYEAYYDAARNVPGADKRVELIAKIVSFLEMNEMVQVDEIDMTMNPKVIFKYPVGDSTTVHPARAGFISSLIVEAASNPAIFDAVSLDFASGFQARVNPRYEKKGVGLTPELLKRELQPRLVAIALSKLKSEIQEFEKIEARDPNNYLPHFLAQSTPFDAEIAKTISPTEQAELAKRQPLDSNSANPKEKLMAAQFCFRQEMNKWIKENVTDESTQELLGTISDVINTIMPKALSDECGTHYGKDPVAGNYVARPYAAPKCPKVSIYGDAYEQVVYSTQMTLYYGIPKVAGEKMLKALQREAKAEMAQGVPITETDAYKRFEKLMAGSKTAYQLLEIPPTDAFITAFTQGCSNDKTAIVEFLQGYVFPQIKIFEESISSTPQTHIGSSKCACGYTGTLHKGILSRTQEAIPEAGTDGKTIIAVESKMKQGLATTAVYKNDSCIKELTHVIATDKEMQVFIDSGGWLKEIPMRAFAENLLKACKAAGRAVEGVVYHNEKGQIVSLEPSTAGSSELIEVPVADSKYKTQDGSLLTVIATRYETGTNIPQKPNAKAHLSVRKGMTKRDALQAIFRMRQILFGQSVSFVMTEEVKNHVAASIFDGLQAKPEFLQFLGGGPSLKLPANLGETLERARKGFKEYLDALPTEEKVKKENVSHFADFFAQQFSPDSEDLWRYFTANEALMEQEKNWEAGKHKMREVIEKPLRMLLSDTKVPLKEQKEAFQLFKHFFVQKTKDSRFGKVTAETTLVDAQTAIDAEIAKQLQLLKALDKNPALKKRYNEKVEEIGKREKIAGTASDIIKEQLNSCVNAKDIPPYIKIGVEALGQELEEEIEQEAEEEREDEVEDEVEKEIYVDRNLRRDPKVYIPLVGTSPTSGYDISQFFGKRFDTLATALPATLLLADTTRIEFSQNLFIDKAEVGSNAHGAHHLPGRYLLALSPPDRFILVSNQDADLIHKGILRAALLPGQSASLVSFDGKPIVATQEMKIDPLILLQAKLVSCKTNYNNAEIRLLQELLDDNPDNVLRLQKFFEHAISFLPSAARNYQGSTLQRFFAGYKMQPEREKTPSPKPHLGY